MGQKTSSKRSGAGENSNGNGASREYERLLKLAKENPWRLFNAGEMVVLFNIGEKAMTRLRKLSMKDRKSDPWSGDKTHPEKFAEWFWGRRIELEEKHRDI
jgi:hypothetical protein